MPRAGLNEDRVVDAFFEHHGIWRAQDMRGLVEATELYLRGWKPNGRRLVAISNSGAVCVLTADAATADDPAAGHRTDNGHLVDR